jgi:hypothetical protein
MKVGERRETVVDASRVWSVTDVVLQRGGTYDFEASGDWWDASIHYDASGRLLAPLTLQQRVILGAFTWLKRVPQEGWFVLIGALDCDMRTAFRIGAGRQLTMTAGGTLTCFPNDVATKYDNNRGTLKLTVARVG